MYDDFWYDMRNGYLDVYDILVGDDARKVLAAVNLLLTFKHEAEENGAIEAL